jgi:hypothetical protein
MNISVFGDPYYCAIYAAEKRSLVVGYSGPEEALLPTMIIFFVGCWKLLHTKTSRFGIIFAKSYFQVLVHARSLTPCCLMRGKRRFKVKTIIQIPGSHFTLFF